MYKIVGADHKEYGPVTAEQITLWIKEGRANGQTIARRDDGPWKPLSTYSEFASLLEAAAPPPPASAARPQFQSPAKTNAWAVTGLILGILGLFQCCAPVFAVSGLASSTIGLVQIHRNPSIYGGKSLAVAGLAVSLGGLVLFVVLLTSGFFHELLRLLPQLP